MMRKKKTSILSCILKPCLVVILFVGVFGLVYMKSNFVKLEYSIGELEKKKMYCLKERKRLFAEKTSQLSFARLESSSDDRGGFILPDRLQVVHVSKQMRSLPQQASLKQKQLSEP
mgnify:CR=1 FL=1